MFAVFASSRKRMLHHAATWVNLILFEGSLNIPRAAKPKSDKKMAIEAVEAGERPALLMLDRTARLGDVTGRANGGTGSRP